MKRILTIVLILGALTQNSFGQVLLGSSSYTGGTGDFTDVVNPPLKLVAPVNYIRIPHVSASSTISTVYNYQASKNVYWGESNDNGNYFFRGRDASFDRNLSVTGMVNTQGIYLDRSTWPLIIFSENGVQGARIQGTGGMFAVTSTNGANNWLTVNSASGFVGVGTSAPPFRFSVAGASSAEETVFDATNSIDQDLHIRLSNPGAAVKRTIISPSTTGRLSLGVGLNEYLTIINGGNVGIGVTNPNTKLSVAGSLTTEESIVNITNNTDQDFQVRVSAANAAAKRTMLFPSTTGRLSLGVGVNNEYLTITNGGNVGIGSVNPNQKLTVNGTIYGKEVKVDLSVPGPDYVFSKTYSLRSLKDVESYIEENQHLPEVPSASEMEKDGIKVGEMNMLLLKKVEELTLYVIDLQKQVDEMKKGRK